MAIKKIGIFGLRQTADLDGILAKLNKVTEFKEGNCTLITHDENGVCAISRDIAKTLKLRCKVIRTDWNSGSDAGIRRTNQIISESDIVIVCTDNKDSNLSNVQRTARRMSKRLHSFSIESGKKAYSVEEERPSTEKIVDQKREKVNGNGKESGQKVASVC